MFASVLKKDYQNEIKFSLINLTLLCYLFRPAIPAFKYPFMLAYLSLIIYSVACHRGEILSTLRFAFRTYIIIIILAVILVFSFCFSNKIYLIIFKDIANAFVLLSIFFLMNLLIITKEELKALILNLIILIVVFAGIISIFKLGELLNIFSDNKGVALSNGSNVLQNSYLEQDNNFGILPVVFGIIGLAYLRICTQSRARKLSYDLLLTFFTVSIFFSGSRRGITILFLFIGLLVLTQIVKIFVKNKNIVSLPPRLTLFILFTFLFLFCMTLFTSYSFKNKTLGHIGSRNVALTKENIAAVLFKYNMIIDDKKTYIDLFNKIWDVVPGDPESGWGTHTHKTIFPLSGRNVEIVPTNSKGYLMDSTCEAIQKNGNAYSFTHIASKNVNINDTISASVYCYVSEDFNGEWASLSSEGSVNAETAKFYDLGQKGTWQKLSFKVSCSEGNAAVFLYFARYNVKDFSSLNGYVIYAYPQVKVIRNGLVNPLSELSVERLNYSQEVLNSENRIKNRYPSAENYSSFFQFPANMLYLSETDPIRKWISGAISEDTTYYPFKSKLMVEQAWNRFGDERIVRWLFGIQIFMKEFTWQQKLIGGGFNFLNWYGYYFLKDRKISDWPHNPFIAVLLYSGIIGLLFYCFFIYRVIYYYIKYYKEYKVLAILFLITFFFSFFSGSSPFDPPVMGFFAILPFFIHSVHKKEKESSDLKKTE